MHKSEIYYKWIPFEGKTENPLVLIHGFLETHEIWYKLPLQQLQRPLLLLDVPGFGKSQLLDDNEPSIAYFANEINDLLIAYSIKKFEVVGHSMGGYIGLELLQLNPLMERVVLLNSNFWADHSTKQRDRTRVADLLLKAKNLFINEAIPALFIDKKKQANNIKELVSSAKSGIAEWYAYASLAMRDRKDFTAYLKENPSKVEIIHGELDNLISTENIQKLCTGWKDVQIISDSGHMSIFEEPKKVVELLNQLTAVSR